MPLRILNLFRPGGAKARDGLTQTQREAIADLLHFCMYADNDLTLAEGRVIDEAIASFDWDPKIAFEVFEARSIANARRAKENPDYRNTLLASIDERLTTDPARRQALTVCQRLLAAGGTHPAESQLYAEIETRLQPRGRKG